MEEGVFAIIKVSYNPSTNEKVGGICGTCFFVNKEEFITAHHCFNNTIFEPNIGYPKVDVFLSNGAGQVIHNPKIKKLHPDYDLSVGIVNGQVTSYFSGFSITNTLVGEGVYNLGYPNLRALKIRNLNIVDGKLAVNIDLVIEKQEGIIEGMVNMTSNADDIRFENNRVIVLNYTSELGFSGGPLILSKTGQVTGFMSLVLPPKNDPLRRAIAIPISEIKQFL